MICIRPRGHREAPLTALDHKAPRTDLLPLVQYVPPIAAPGTKPGSIAELWLETAAELRFGQPALLHTRRVKN